MKVNLPAGGGECVYESFIHLIRSETKHRCVAQTHNSSAVALKGICYVYMLILFPFLIGFMYVFTSNGNVFHAWKWQFHNFS